MGMGNEYALYTKFQSQLPSKENLLRIRHFFNLHILKLNRPATNRDLQDAGRKIW